MNWSIEPKRRRASAIRHVDGTLIRGQCRFVQRLGERRVCVNRTLQILGARRVLHRQYGLCNQLACHRTDDVDTENLIVVGCDDDLGETLTGLHRARAALARNGKLPTLYDRPLALTCSSV